MKHSEFIEEYNRLRPNNKLQALKLVKEVFSYGSLSFGLKEAKDLMDESATGEELLIHMKAKYPKNYNVIGFYKHRS